MRTKLALIGGAMVLVLLVLMAQPVPVIRVLRDLQDVKPSIPPGNGDALIFNTASGKWTNGPGGGVSATNIATSAFIFLGSGASAVIQANYTNINGSATSATNSFLIVGGSDNSSTNGILLTNAVGFANAATPGGSAKAQNNRFTIFLLPGTYTVSDGALVLTKEFVDLVGISTETGTRTVSAAGYVLGETVISSTGDTLTINAAGNDDITLANLCIVTSSAGGKDAVKMTTTGTLQKMINLFIRNTSALGNHATPIAQNWAGYYEDVRNWNDSAFGSTGTCSGTFIRCKANNFAFSENGTASGLFIDCEADNGFGGNTCSGTFIRCRFVSVSGTQNVFGFRNGATVSGTLIECIGSGNTTDFGGNSGTMSGTMRYCQNSALPGWTSITGSLIGCDFPTSTAVNIAATGYTNLFGRNTVVYFDGTAVTATVFNGAGTSIYTNAVATTGMGTVILEKGGKVILSGTGVVGRAIPYRGL